MTRKVEELKNKYKVSVATANFISRIDPTPNQKYVEWLFKVRYPKDAKTYAEDFPSNREPMYREALTWFERNLNGKIPVEFRDINVFKTMTEFLNKVGELKTPSRSEIKDQARVVYEDSLWKIITPLTFEASKLYGTGTKWCTTQKGPFDNYTKNGVLYYIIDKAHNRKFGLPIQNTVGMSVIIGNLSFYNNEDTAIRLGNIKLVYGSSFDIIEKVIKEDFTNTMKAKMRGKVLQDAIAKVESIKRTAKEYSLGDEEFEKIVESFMKWASNTRE